MFIVIAFFVKQAKKEIFLILNDFSEKRFYDVQLGIIIFIWSIDAILESIFKERFLEIRPSNFSTHLSSFVMKTERVLRAATCHNLIRINHPLKMHFNHETACDTCNKYTSIRVHVSRIVGQREILTRIWTQIVSRLFYKKKREQFHIIYLSKF